MMSTCCGGPRLHQANQAPDTNYVALSRSVERFGPAVIAMAGSCGDRLDQILSPAAHQRGLDSSTSTASGNPSQARTALSMRRIGSGLAADASFITLNGSRLRCAEIASFSARKSSQIATICDIGDLIHTRYSP